MDSVLPVGSEGSVRAKLGVPKGEKAEMKRAGMKNEAGRGRVRM